MIRPQPLEFVSLGASSFWPTQHKDFANHYGHNNSFGYSIAQYFEILFKYKAVLQFLYSGRDFKENSIKIDRPKKSFLGHGPYNPKTIRNIKNRIEICKQGFHEKP